MPKEGHLSVTMKVYVWNQMERRFEEHRKELRKIGIKSTSGLISYCLEHYPFETLIREKKD